MGIKYFVPFSTSKNLGAEYNRYCSECTDEWIAFKDGDAMFLDNDWGNRVEQVIKDNPDGDIFGCVTNRLRYPDQLFENRCSEETDIMEHKRISDLLWETCGTTCIDAQRPIAGVFLLFRREIWRHIKFHDGIISIDFLFCQEAMDAGYKIKIMTGIYLFHFYRLDKDKNDISHLM